MSVLIRPAKDLEFSTESLKDLEAKWVFYNGNKVLSIPEECWPYYRLHHTRLSSINYIDIIGPNEMFGTLGDYKYFLNTKKLEKPLVFNEPDLSFQWCIDKSNRNIHVLRYKSDNLYVTKLHLADIGWTPCVEEKGLIICGENKSYVDTTIVGSLATSYGWIALKVTPHEAVVVCNQLITRGDDDFYLKNIGDLIPIPVTVDI